MYRLETPGDYVFFVVLSVLVGAMGVLMLIFPTEPLPEDPDAYRKVHGVLREFKDERPRRSTAVTFTVENDPQVFVSYSAPTAESARDWQAGRTFVEFFVLARMDDAPGGVSRLPAYGLKVEGQELRSLRDDIAFHNAGAVGWPALMPIGLGVAGLIVLVLRWRQRSAAQALAAGSASSRRSR